MRIGIFGGTFNPPHIGHIQAAKTAVMQQNLDLLIVIPAGIPPHKPLPNGTPDPKIRFIMTENAFLNEPNTVISDIEIFSKNKNFTIDTITALKNDYTDCEFYLLVGTDMYDSLNTWKDSEKLLMYVNPVLLSRDIITISSSELRDMLPLRKGRNYLNDSNYKLIIRHRLYGAKPDWDWLRDRAHSMLDPNRIAHVDACEAAAMDLAKRWGADVEDAREAAILHDITKKLDFNENMCIIAEHGVSINPLGKGEEKLLHSITGATLAQTEFGVSDNVAQAIKWHTTGRAGMTLIEKIIYIADYIESTRDFPGVDDLRKTAYENIDEAMIIGLEMTVNDLNSRGITPNASTIEAINDLKR